MDMPLLTPKEERRYNRHFLLPEIGKEGQVRLKKTRVLIVGAGGLGCPALQYLAAAGVGTIGIADNDRVSEDNLQRQVLYGEKDLGKMKAIIARDRLQHHNPMVEYRVHNVYLQPGNVLDLLRDYDVIVDATDNYPTRYLLNDACVILGKPWVFGAIYKYEGQVSVFNFRNGPSLRCIFPEPPLPQEAPDPSRMGMMGVLPGIIGTIMANEVIKMVSGTGSCLNGKMLLLNIMNYSVQTLSINKKDRNYSLDKMKEDYSGKQKSGKGSGR